MTALAALAFGLVAILVMREAEAAGYRWRAEVSRALRILSAVLIGAACAALLVLLVSLLVLIFSA